jgi:hypothetical protein
VEQKNWSVVRRLASYSRYNTEEELDILNRIYDMARLYQSSRSSNCWARRGLGQGYRAIRRSQDAIPKSVGIRPGKPKHKDHLRETFDRLNPTEIKRKVERLHKELRKTGAERALRPKKWPKKARLLSFGERFQIRQFGSSTILCD